MKNILEQQISNHPKFPNIKYLKKPSFDYFFDLLTNEDSPSPIKLLRSHI